LEVHYQFQVPACPPRDQPLWVDRQRTRSARARCRTNDRLSAIPRRLAIRVCQRSTGLRTPRSGPRYAQAQMWGRQSSHQSWLRESIPATMRSHENFPTNRRRSGLGCGRSASKRYPRSGRLRTASSACRRSQPSTL
jgi:hypothetical protein